MSKIIDPAEAKRLLDQAIERAREVYRKRLELHAAPPKPPPRNVKGVRDWPRYEKAFDLRETGMSFAEIGRQMEVCGERAKQMVKSYERHMAKKRS